VEAKGTNQIGTGSKSFFRHYLCQSEYHMRIFKNGSYFFNSTKLHHRFLMESFVSYKGFIETSIWIHIYSLPKEFWDKEILASIENALGHFVKVTKDTKQAR